jgi:hypothetical protein
MLHKCANPDCPRTFRSLNHGKLFLLETDRSADQISGAIPMRRRVKVAPSVERYWLCDGCSALLTLTFERGRGMVTVPLPAANTQGHGLHLKPMQPAMRSQPRVERAI